MAQSSPYDGQPPNCPVAVETEDLSFSHSIPPTASHVRLKKPRLALALAFIKRQVKWLTWSILAGSSGVLTYALLAPQSGKIFQITLPWQVEVPLVVGIFLLGATLTYISQLKKNAQS